MASLSNVVQTIDRFAEIYVILQEHADDNLVPVFNKQDWKNVVDRYDKKKVIEVLAYYIINEKPTFPLRKIDLKNMTNSFNNLWKRDILTLKVMQTTSDGGGVLYTGDMYDIKLKYDYDATAIGNSEDDAEGAGGGEKKCLYAIQLGHEYNDASSYFQQENRLRCNSYGYKGPLNAWEDLEELKKMNWTFWRPSMVGKNGIRDRDYRSSMRVSGYVATQFKPHVAKCIYLMNNAERILDTSCGWGDRLVAFYCSDCAKVYHGCDPNEHVYESYKNQCFEYEKLLGTDIDDIDFIEDFIVIGNKEIRYFECYGKKTVLIYNGCAEDLILSEEDDFDLLFTSPPYFKTERYNEGGDGEYLQSWKRYDTFEKWRDRFLFKMIQNVSVCLRKGGKIMLNIVDPQIKTKRYKVCDDMVKYVCKLGFNYDGWILQRMKGGPAKKGLCGENWFGEPIFSFTKN
tara:strand:+ start:358 stop:1725 length:1368 start_codon:yes stop_codon:yes gene_type:complete